MPYTGWCPNDFNIQVRARGAVADGEVETEGERPRSALRLGPAEAVPRTAAHTRPGTHPGTEAGRAPAAAATKQQWQRELHSERGVTLAQTMQGGACIPRVGTQL
jgi:hypothetical protein